MSGFDARGARPGRCTARAARRAARVLAGRVPVAGRARGRRAAGCPAGSGAAEAKPSHKQDVAILNFALSLEYLQDSFYTEVERLGGFRGPLGEQARTVAAHERAHVVALREVLGGKAVKRGRYDFRGATESR